VHCVPALNIAGHFLRYHFKFSRRTAGLQHEHMLQSKAGAEVAAASKAIVESGVNQV
jgi:hypothetical protein